jgi:CHAT domain-containing protein
MLASATAAAEQEWQSGRAEPSGELAIFADPVFSSDDDRVQTAHQSRPAPLSDGSEGITSDPGLNSLPRLSSSREEAQAISRLAPAGREWIALGFDANRAAVESARLSQYRIVHFATHALIDNQHPELSAIVLSMVDRRDHAEDGFLRLHEIYGLKLNADLVVLSGCETALGRAVRSEGLVGLTQGFFYAGSRQVMASLWSVQDRATADFMRLFYQALLRRNMDPATALQSAQAAMMKDARWSDPYYWAAFVLEGAEPHKR